MKKLLVIIVILLVIFVGMLIGQNSQRQSQLVSVEEVKKIETYLQKIYLWKEITGQALPTFEQINDADETWIWEVVKKNLEKDELSYEQIQKEAKELFGPDFMKEYPKEKTTVFQYDEETQQYLPTATILDEQKDSFLLDTIQKTKEGYEVEVIEYIEDYSTGEELERGENEIVEIKNTTGEIITSINSSEIDSKVVDLVKENKEKFTKKKIYLVKQEEKLCVKKVEE